MLVVFTAGQELRDLCDVSQSDGVRARPKQAQHTIKTHTHTHSLTSLLIHTQHTHTHTSTYNRLAVDLDGVEVVLRLVGPVKAERREASWVLPRLLPTEATQHTFSITPTG